MTSAELREIVIAAINAARASRGKNKGMLKASCPRSDTDAAAAWQAITLHANPYKFSIWQAWAFTDRQRAIYDAIDKALAGVDCRGADRDRVALERMGAW